MKQSIKNKSVTKNNLLKLAIVPLLAGRVLSVQAGSKTLIENPYKMWNEINPKLPNVAIEVMGVMIIPFV